MKIMTEEYCRQCPFFTPGLGYLPEDHPYWKTLPDNHCICRACPDREKCEKQGCPDDMAVCIKINFIDQLTPEGVQGLHDWLLATKEVSWNDLGTFRDQILAYSGRKQ